MRAAINSILALVAAWALAATPAQAAPAYANVGFETLTISNPAGKPIEIGVWYPTDAKASPQPLGGFTQTVAPDANPAGARHPLVVMSHGSGGWFAGHYDTALSLAHQGFVVAALTHPGDNFKDGAGAADVAARPRQFHRLTDYMLDEWPDRGVIDPARVGVFGFSAGGFTTLVAIGGVPDLSGFADHCKAHPDYFDCGVVKKAGLPANVGALFPPSVWMHDPRIKAAVVAAPALGFTFAPNGLKDVKIPVQLWRAEFDHVLPHPDYAEAARKALPSPPDYHLVKNGDHYDFLAPCDAGLAARIPEICASRPGFDRPAFHAAFDKAVVAFFQRTLR